MKPDLKKAMLASIERDPGPPCEVTVFYSSPSVAGFMAQYLKDEWNITKLVFKADEKGGGRRFLFETTGARASVILTELRHAHPRGYKNGWSVAK